MRPCPPPVATVSASDVFLRDQNLMTNFDGETPARGPGGVERCHIDPPNHWIGGPSHAPAVLGSSAQQIIASDEPPPRAPAAGAPRGVSGSAAGKPNTPRRRRSFWSCANPMVAERARLLNAEAARPVLGSEMSGALE